jgi:pimeloyl-ACP methyl ester carboxylesterase
VPDSVPPTLRIIRGANRTLGRVAPAVAARLNARLFSRPRRFTPKEWEAAFERLGTRRRLASGVSVLTAGEGPVAALMHGWEGRATQFAAFAPALLERGYRVVAIDGPAHGHSRGDRADPYRFAETLLEVQHTFGPLEAAIGHSMGGGSIAIALASGLALQRAVLIASPASLHEVLHRFADTVHMPSRATAHFVDWLRAEVVARGHRDVDVLQLVSNLLTRALVIHARDDREVPFSDGERIAAHWPGAALVAVDGVGHRRILRDPTTIAAAMEFVAGS